MHQKTDTGSAPAVVATSLQGAHTILAGEAAGGQGMVRRTLHLMFLCCLNMPGETQSKMHNAFHA